MSLGNITDVRPQNIYCDHYLTHIYYLYCPFLAWNLTNLIEYNNILKIRSAAREIHF